MEKENATRQCIVSGARAPKDELLRFVIGPEQDVVADVEGKLPGRGIWVRADREMLNTAIEKNLFAKAARARVRVPDGLADQVERLLSRRCLNLIGLARRAGQAVAGFEKARAYLGGARAGLLLAASDGGPSGRAKIRALAPAAPVLEIFSGDELGAAVGQQRAVHMVIAPGRLCDGILRDAGRLAGFRGALAHRGGTGAEAS